MTLVLEADGVGSLGRAYAETPEKISGRPELERLGAAPPVEQERGVHHVCSERTTVAS